MASSEPASKDTVAGAAAASSSTSPAWLTATATVSAATVEPVRDSVNAAAVPSATAGPASIVTTGRSSSSIVPVAVASAASAAFVDTPESVTVNVSSASLVVSCAVGTSNVPDGWPAVTLTVPVVVVPRSAATAVSPLSIDAVQVAVTSAAAAADSVAVKVTSPPSVAAASATLSVGSVEGVTMRPAGHVWVSVRRHTVAVLPTGNSVSRSSSAAGTDQNTLWLMLTGAIRSENASVCPPNSSVRVSSD